MQSKHKDDEYQQEENMEENTINKMRNAHEIVGETIRLMTGMVVLVTAIAVVGISVIVSAAVSACRKK